MANIQTILLAVLIVLNVIILIQVRAFFKELRSPVVKKLGPDLNLKGRRVNFQDNRQNASRDNRPQQTQNQQRPGNGNGPRPTNAPSTSGQPGERSDRNDRGERNDRGDRNDRNDRDRNRGDRNDRNRNDRNRNDRNDRNRGDRNDRNRRPAEMIGNEASETAKQVEEGVNPEIQVNEVRAPRPAFEGRRPLEPRIAEPEQVSAVSSENTSGDASGSEGGVEFDPSRIRHGRRPMVKKAPQFEEETGTAG